MTRHLLIAAAVLLAPVTYAADAAKTPPTPAAAAFERLKALVGEWDSVSAPVKSHLTYQLTGGGSALVENETPEGMGAMMTVYHLDGDRIILTHYCMAGNQPRMEARTFSDPGEITFSFLDITNLASPKAGYMHDAKIRLVDSKHLASTWRFFINGEPSRTEEFSYVRVK